MSNLQDQILKRVDEVPSLPITVTKILEVTKDPTVSPTDLNRVISLDPILTGKVLQLVNSAYYSLSTKVTSIVKAIILLGINTIRNLALTTAVVPIVGAQTRKTWMVLDAGDYWKHSIGTGATAKLIGRTIGVAKEQLEEYFICGLLHDVGKIILDHTLQDEYLKVLDWSKQKNCSLISAENEMLEINHAHVGKLLAEKWGLSSEVIESIYCHHNPKECSEENRRLVYSVAIANSFCNLANIGFSGDSFQPELDEELLAFLTLSSAKLNELKEQVDIELQKASVFMNIPSK